MIHVKLRPEPDTFNSRVRQKGHAWMNKHQTLPPSNKFPRYWKDCLDDLRSSYKDHCAYLAVQIEEVEGEYPSVDHFLAKSRRPDLAYEWSNYRLSCSEINSLKGNSDDVLDPFEIKNNCFHLDLEFLIGHIYSNKAIPPDQREGIQATIDKLRLNNDKYREMREQHYQDCREGHYDSDYLKRISPFVWSEAKRQGLLKDNG